MCYVTIAVNICLHQLWSFCCLRRNAGTFCALDIALRRLRALDPADAANAAGAVKVRQLKLAVEKPAETSVSA